MKIKEVTQNYIMFENGKKIECDLDQESGVENYADFEQLDDIARVTDFDYDRLEFESYVYGFRFGNKPEKMFFIPCYSEQNGYYTPYVDILFDGEIRAIAQGEIEYWTKSPMWVETK